MNLLLVADCYPPLRISGAQQMRDLAVALVEHGYSVTVLVPTAHSHSLFTVGFEQGVRVIRVRCPKTKDVSLPRRAVSERFLPLILWIGFRLSGAYREDWCGIVSYSPSIFLGLLTKRLKKDFLCRSYLILRDIFPDWAADAGVMSRQGLVFKYFKRVQCLQYLSSDVIGVQSGSNISTVRDYVQQGVEIEVLNNWLSPCQPSGTIDGDDATWLETRKVFVYAGNMGAAQDLMPFIEAAKILQHDDRIGFMFIGRGSMVPELKRASEGLRNVRIWPEVGESELAALLRKCFFGVIALDLRHETHNIPGKLITYLYSGLPVLARVDAHSDLSRLVSEMLVGVVVSTAGPDELAQTIVDIVEGRISDYRWGNSCVDLAESVFSPSAAARQIVRSLGLERSQDATLISATPSCVGTE